MKTLRLGPDLELPLKAVTEKIAWLGRTGSGKTYGAMRLAELMLEAGAQIGALDPVGVWRGLRIPAVKGGPSFEVVVFGGLYRDLPLEPTAGELVADLICDRGISFVLDVSQFIPAEQQRFVRAFADRFFHRKKSAPSAVHLFMEECQEFIPENPSGEEAKTLGVMQRLWKLGRNFGIGGSLISQRPQEIAKKALNMSGTLFAFQMTGPQERKAIKAWVADHGVALDIESVLQKLEVGQPHVESPMFLEISKTVRISRRVTADLSSTPEVGVSTAAKRPLTPIDVEQLEIAMAATIERAKAEDPRELRKTIADLKAKLAAAEKAKPAAPVKAPREKAVLKEAQVKRLEAAANKIEKTWDLAGLHMTRTTEACMRIADAARPLLVEIKAALAAVRAQPGGAHVDGIERNPGAGRVTSGGVRVASVRPAHVVPRPAPPRPTRAPANGHDGGAITGPEQKVLDELASLEALGITTPPKGQVSVLCGYANPRSGGFSGPLGRLAAAGLITYPRSGEMALTDAGRARAQAPDAPLTNEILHERVLDKFYGPRARVLRELIAAYPDALDKAALALQLGYENPRSGGFSGPLGSLSKLGLVRYPSSGQVAATNLLFLEGV